MCLVSYVRQWCHYWAARITLPAMSCLSAPSLSLVPLFSFSLYPPACDWPMVFVCHLYTQDALSLIHVSHNALHNCHFIFIPCSLYPSQVRMMCSHGTEEECNSRKSLKSCIMKTKILKVTVISSPSLVIRPHPRFIKVHDGPLHSCTGSNMSTAWKFKQSNLLLFTFLFAMK